MTSRSQRGRRLTPAQRQALLACYLAHGFHAAKPLAESLGISPRHLARLARNNGHVHNYQRKQPAALRAASARDPRWQWAIARGRVVV